MLLNLKALVVVLAFALAVFALAKPMALRFMYPEDFARRRMVWLVLTIVGFVSPSFWLYFLIGLPLVVWAAKRDSTPLALYVLLMFVIPPMEVRIPTIGIGQLFDLSNIRMLGFAILIPLAWKRMTGEGRGGTSMDLILIAYGLLQLVLFLPYESLTNTMRRGFLFFLDAYVVYFAFSRDLVDRQKLTDVLGAFCLSAALFAPMAVFESVRGWLLYVGIGQVWDHTNLDAYLMRGDSLRAQAGVGHSISLGWLMALGIGAAMYLTSWQESIFKTRACYVLLSIGLLFTFARGPWVAAAVMVVVFTVIASRSASQAMKSVILLSLFLGLAALTPLGARVIENLPFIGTAGQASVTYRQQLAELSWALILQHPFFGDPFVMAQMESLRPGEGGIIDLVNGYIQVALFNGLVGLTLFSLLFVAALLNAFSTFRRAKLNADYEMASLGGCLIALMVSMLVFIATAGSVYQQWLLAGLLAAYSRLEVASLNIAEHSSLQSTLRQRRNYA